MKKLSILLFTIPGFYFAQLASGIAIHDTRSTNNSPSEYRHQIQGDFKYRSTVGAPGEGLYSGMLTIAPWGIIVEINITNLISTTEVFSIERVFQKDNGKTGSNC